MKKNALKLLSLLAVVLFAGVGLTSSTMLEEEDPIAFCIAVPDNNSGVCVVSDAGEDCRRPINEHTFDCYGTVGN